MDELHKQAVDLLYKYRNYIDRPDAPLAVSTKHEMEELIQCFKKQLNARDLAERVERIEKLLLSMSDEMSISEHIDLKDRFEEMRRHLKGHF